jgi:hypothetical protein
VFSGQKLIKEDSLMKHTTSRKKMLISSVAMLLVAMMALGSATFAWFTSDPTADAKGLVMHTESSTGLLVLSDTEKAIDSTAWSHHTFLNATAIGTSSTTSQLLTPVSLSTSNSVGSAFGSFYTTVAADGSSYKQDATKTITSATSGYYKEKINVKVTGGKASADLKLTGLGWTATSDPLSAAVRVAVEGTDGNLVGIFAIDTEGNGYLANTTYNSDNPTYTTTKQTETLTTALSAGTAKADGSTSIIVYVYLDGEDTACKSDQVSSADIMKDLVVNLAVEDTAA